MEEHIIIRLRRGEQIKCPKCGEAYITTRALDISISHAFHCPNCDWHIYVDDPIDISWW